MNIHTEERPLPRLAMDEERSSHLIITRPDIALVIEPDGMHVLNPVLDEAIRLFQPREILLSISLQIAKSALTFPAMSPAQFFYDLKRRGLRLETMENGMQLSGQTGLITEAMRTYVRDHQQDLAELLAADVQLLAQLTPHAEFFL